MHSGFQCGYSLIPPVQFELILVWIFETGSENFSHRLSQLQTTRPLFCWPNCGLDGFWVFLIKRTNNVTKVSRIARSILGRIDTYRQTAIDDESVWSLTSSGLGLTILITCSWIIDDVWPSAIVWSRWRRYYAEPRHLRTIHHLKNKMHVSLELLHYGSPLCAWLESYQPSNQVWCHSLWSDLSSLSQCQKNTSCDFVISRNSYTVFKISF